MRLIGVLLVMVMALAGAPRAASADTPKKGAAFDPATFGEPLDRESVRGAQRASDDATSSDAKSEWCAPELETLANDVCYAKGPESKTGRRTLVIFLHGLVKEKSGWQHALMRGMANAGKRYGFSLLTPRGRPRIGPGEKDDMIAWPNAASLRDLEDVVIREWMEAKETIEKRQGAPFDEVFVMGFSNGAYYASSLALRGRLDVDGYAVFAGGSAPKGTVANAKPVKNRRPVYVGIASKDETAKKGKELAKALKELKWPNLVASRPVGHVVADDHLSGALEFLRGKAAKAKDKPSSKDKSDKPERGDKTEKTEKVDKKHPKAKSSASKKNKKKSGKKP